MQYEAMLDIEIELEFDGRRTIATVSSPRTGLTGTGIARCKDDDEYHANIGTDLALGRAFVDLGQKVADRAAALAITHDQAEAYGVR